MRDSGKPSLVRAGQTVGWATAVFAVLTAGSFGAITPATWLGALATLYGAQAFIRPPSHSSSGPLWAARSPT